MPFGSMSSMTIIMFTTIMEDISNGQCLILKRNYNFLLLSSCCHMVALDEFKILLTIHEFIYGNPK